MIILRHVYGDTKERFQSALERLQEDLTERGAELVTVSYSSAMVSSPYGRVETFSAVITAEIRSTRRDVLAERVQSETIPPPRNPMKPS